VRLSRLGLPSGRHSRALAQAAQLTPARSDWARYHRRQHDPTTRAYIERRVAEGKSRREATRLLKRYLVRHLYRLLQQTEPLMT
jgi:hypothetical protein